MRESEAEVRHRLIAVPGATLHAVESGPPDGPPVVLLHGFPETWWSWRHQLAPLAAAGHRVVAIDLRGFGASSKSGPFDLSTLAGDVAAVVASLGRGPVPIVGHDWGGGAAWIAAARHPEAVSRVAVLNCPLPHVLQRALVRRPRWSQLKRSWYMFFFQLPWLPSWLLLRQGARGVAGSIRNAAVVKTHMGRDELEPFCAAALEPGAIAGMLGPYRAAFRDLLLRRGASDAGREVRVEQPALLVWGADDPALGFDELVPGSERWVPRLRVERLDGVGHFPQSEAPERVTSLLLAFLAEDRS
ncbi:MAG: alpha/beta hydrolase [Myxococcota bacterium]